MIPKPELKAEPNLTNLRMPGLGNLTIDLLKDMIEKSCIQYGLNVSIAEDTITSGRLFDKSKTSCITIANAEHPKDYFIEVVTLKTQGTYAFVEFYYTGNSKNTRRVADGDREHKTLTGSIVGAIKKATVSNDAMKEENNYYTMLCDAITAAFQ